MFLLIFFLSALFLTGKTYVLSPLGFENLLEGLTELTETVTLMIIFVIAKGYGLKSAPGKGCLVPNTRGLRMWNFQPPSPSEISTE